MQPTRDAGAIDTPEYPNQSEWRRSSFVSILGNLKHSIGILCRSYMEIGGLSVLVFGFTKSLSLTAAIVLGIASALVALSALLSYWFLRFKISQGHIEIISGVFKRTHLNIPFERVQQLSTEQPLYYRWLGDFVDVKIDTAGSDDIEAVLPAIRQHEYAQLQQRIGCKSERALDGDPHHTAEDYLNAPAHQDDIVFQQNAWSLLLYGIFQNKLLWFIAIIIGFFEKLTDALTRIKERLPDQSAAIDSMTTIDTTPVAGLAVLLVVIGIFTFLSFSALYSFAEYYRFTLSRTSDGYLTTQGWLKKVMHRAAKRKIQGVVIRRNIAEAWSGRQNIIIEQFGATPMTLPCVDAAQSHQLLAVLCPGQQLSSESLKRGNFVFVVKNWLLMSLPLCGLAYAFHLAGSSDNIVLLTNFTLCIAAGFAVFNYLRWYRRAYAQDGQYFYLRRGRLVEKTLIIDKHKLQAASISQNLLMKKLGLCSVTLYFSTGKFCIPYLPYPHGLALANSGMDAVMQSDKLWI